MSYKPCNRGILKPANLNEKLSFLILIRVFASFYFASIQDDTLADIQL